MIKEYLRFIREYFKIAKIKAHYVVITLLTAFLYKGFSILIPLIGSLIIQFLSEGNAEFSYLTLGAFLVAYLLYSASLYANYKIYSRTVTYCYDKLTSKILNKLISVDSNFTRYVSKGRLMNSINGDIGNVGDMSDRIAEVTMGALQIIAVLVIVGFCNIYLALIMIIYALVYIAFRNAADRQSSIYHEKQLTQSDKYVNLLSQVISGLQEIKTFNILPKLYSKLDLIQRKFDKYYTLKRKYITRRHVDSRVIVYTSRFILYVISILLLANGRIDLGVLVLVISYHNYLTLYIDYFIDSTAAIRETNISVRRLNSILNYKSEKIPYGMLDIDEIHGIIEMRDVSLAIGQNTILSDINLKIGHNEVVAIVGEAGSGKTMLFNLLLRLYKPSSGQITLDNTNIYDFNKKSYASNVSIVNQKPFIFNMSIRKNLNLVNPDIKKQIAACQAAGIHDFIETLPNGYNTVLRENGSNVSGGQKQMLSIARTILTEAEVLLLDDITTSLDPDTAKLVPRLLQRLKKDHTIIMITKKPELMREADRIVVLDHGRINDSGTHQQLLARNEIYQTLQARKSPSKIGVFTNV